MEMFIGLTAVVLILAILLGSFLLLEVIDLKGKQTELELLKYQRIIPPN